MTRLFFIGAAAVAALGAATVPAVAGIAGNPSFSHKLPVHVPSQAQLATFDDHGAPVGASSTAGSTHRSAATPKVTPSTVRPPTSEPGDDNGGLRTTAGTEPGDDNGGLRTTAGTEPGDDNGGLRTTPTAAATAQPQATDDHGGLRSSSASGHGGGSGH